MRMRPFSDSCPLILQKRRKSGGNLSWRWALGLPIVAVNRNDQRDRLIWLDPTNQQYKVKRESLQKQVTDANKKRDQDTEQREHPMAVCSGKFGWRRGFGGKQEGKSQGLKAQRGTSVRQFREGKNKRRP
jgi:hypothetical protein